MEHSRRSHAEILAPRRAATAPGGSQANNDDAGRSGAVVETLYSHPDVKIISFAASPGTAGRANDGAAPAVLADEEPELGTLSWSSRLERIIAVGPFRMYRALGSVAFLSCGSALQPILPKSQCWCIDQVNSKFVLQIRRPNYWRIELPVSNAEDRERARQFRHVLDGVLRFEKTQCPFRRSFTVALPETPRLPAGKRPWAPVRPDVPTAPPHGPGEQGRGAVSSRAGDGGRGSCPAGSVPSTPSASILPTGRAHVLPDERRGSVLAAAEAWEAACSRLADYAQTDQTPRRGDAPCPSCQNTVAPEMAASRDNQSQARSLDGDPTEPSDYRVREDPGRRNDLQPRLRHTGGFGIRSSSVLSAQLTAVASPASSSTTARPSVHDGELSAEDSGSEDSFHSLQSSPLSCPGSQSESSATESCDGHRDESTATGIRRRAATSGSRAMQRPMSPVVPPADVLSQQSLLDQSQRYQTRVGMVRRLPIYIISKTCEILLGPLSHLIALMLRVAARICAGEWRGQVDGFGESGERIPVEWDYSNGELSDWTDDDE